MTKKLRQIESLYAHTDLVFGPSFLDNALGTVNDALLSDMLESWFISIKNQSDIGPSDEARWRAGLSFVVCIITRLSKANLPTERLRKMEVRLHRLSHLYGQLHVQRNRRPSFPRSLPASVVHALYEILDPSSTTNPFARQCTRWLAFLAFVLMLHQGLRRGEVLLLTADAVKDGFDERQGRLRSWLNVRESKYASDDDPRHSRPSIKSPNSVRQLPVSDTISSMVQAYVENYRGKPNHPFLLNTQQNTPLSTESMTKLLPLMHRYPDIRIEFDVSYALRDIVADRFDAGVRLGESIDKDMIALPISPKVRMAAAASPAYFDKHPIPKVPADLTRHSCINIRFATSGGLYVWEFERNGRQVNVRVESQAVFNTSPPMVQAALDGLGITFLPEEEFGDHIEQGRLVRVLQNWCPPFPGYHLYYPSRRQHSAAFALVVDALRI